MWLYHATYRKNLPSIRKNGLGGKHRKNWKNSIDGMICFANDPYIAVDFCETAENVSDSVYESGIIVFAVNSNDINTELLTKDINILDENNDFSFMFPEIISTEYLWVITDKDGLLGTLDKVKRVPSFYKNR